MWKKFSSWICWKAPTGGSFNTSWSCARPYGIIRPISSVPGSGRTPRSTFLSPMSDSTITCERSTMYLWAKRNCIPSMTVQLRWRQRRKKICFIANSSSCTTTELSKLLTSCLTTIKNHVIKYCEKVYERSGKNLFWSIKNSCEVLNKL